MVVLRPPPPSDRFAKLQSPRGSDSGTSTSTSSKLSNGGRAAERPGSGSKGVAAGEEEEAAGDGAGSSSSPESVAGAANLSSPSASLEVTPSLHLRPPLTALPPSISSEELPANLLACLVDPSSLTYLRLPDGKLYKLGFGAR